MQPREAPPAWRAFSGRSPSSPPPISETRSRSEMPKGTSTSPAFLTAPSSEKIVVPGVRGVPMLVYHAAPRVTIGATLAQVFTLFTTVGFPHRPLVTG